LHSSLLSLQEPHVQTCDLSDNIPGYETTYADARQRIQVAVENGESRPTASVLAFVSILCQPYP
jgi:hypothetical protein